MPVVKRPYVYMGDICLPESIKGYFVLEFLIKVPPGSAIVLAGFPVVFLCINISWWCDRAAVLECPEQFLEPIVVIEQ